MKIILASHGFLADEMLKVLHMILGDEDDVESFCLDTYENPLALSQQVKKKIEEVKDEPVTLVCDIKGGSVFNQLLPLCTNQRVTLYSGMNLDLVLSLVNIQPETEEDFEEVTGEAKSGIVRYNREHLEKAVGGNDADGL